MAVNSKKALKHAEGMPGLMEVIKAKRGRIPILSGKHTHAEMVWDFNDRASEEQVFILKLGSDEYFFSKQAFERLLRAV